MLIKGSSSCDHCNYRKATLCSKNHVARLCVPCDKKLHSHVTTEDNYSRFQLCHNCRSSPAVIQCFDQSLFLCQTCVSDANLISRFYRYNCPLPRDLDPDSSSSPSSCLIDPSYRFPFVSSLSPPNNGDSSLSPSSGMIFQNFDTYTNNYSDYIQPVPMLYPDLLDILKGSSCSSFDGFKTKEEIENVLLSSPEGDGVVLDCFSGEDSILTNHFTMDELWKITGTMTEVIPLSSSPLGIHKDYNIDQALASCNASPQDYNKNQMIGLSKLAKEDTMTSNNLGMFHNISSVQIDCGQSQLILTDEMLPWDDQTLVSAVYNPLAREEAKKRYFAKKMKRKFGKQIRYESRKSTADTKRRMKGRFTKAGAEYDYDPRANNTDHKEMNKIMMT